MIDFTAVWILTKRIDNETKKSEKVFFIDYLLAIVFIWKRFNKLLLYILVIKSNIAGSGQILKDINDLVFAKSKENCVTHLV